MRWNCPHCETLVTATIDFENTKKAYVRCAKCKGMALIHRSAALAGYVKARRLEEEAQLEAELRQNAMQIMLDQAEAEKARLEKAEAKHRAEALAHANEVKASITASKNKEMVSSTETFSFIIPPAPNAEMQMMDASIEMSPMTAQAPAVEMTATAPTEMPASPLRMTAPETNAVDISSVLAAAEALFESDHSAQATPTPPPFLYMKPPAFLLRENTEAVKAFSGVEETVVITKPSKRSNANLAVWVAAALALGSGIYLFMEGRKALTPATTVISEMSAAGLLKAQ